MALYKLRKMKNKALIFALISIQFLIGITALAGGSSLIMTNGLGVPVSWLNGYFNSFFIPGLALIFVSVVNLFAAWTFFADKPYKFEMGAAAGFSIIIFEIMELYIVLHSQWLQLIYSFLGIISLVLIMILMKGSNHNYRSKI